VTTSEGKVGDTDSDETLSPRRAHEKVKETTKTLGMEGAGGNDTGGEGDEDDELVVVFCSTTPEASEDVTRVGVLSHMTNRTPLPVASAPTATPRSAHTN
jgi:hypothetical protein